MCVGRVWAPEKRAGLLRFCVCCCRRPKCQIHGRCGPLVHFSALLSGTHANNDNNVCAHFVKQTVEGVTIQKFMSNEVVV